MTKTMRMAYTEVDEILKYLPLSYVEKIPMKMRKLFAQCRLPDYKVNIDPNRSISEQKVVYETLVIFTILKMNYWCEKAEDKAALKQRLIANSNKKEEFNYIFHPVDRNPKNLPAKVEKSSLFHRIWEKIKKFFLK